MNDTKFVIWKKGQTQEIENLIGSMANHGFDIQKKPRNYKSAAIQHLVLGLLGKGGEFIVATPNKKDIIASRGYTITQETELPASVGMTVFKVVAS